MMTPDKDFAQLVSDNIFMFKPSRSGNESVKWGVEDIKREFSGREAGTGNRYSGPNGRTADNIPGAPGWDQKQQ